MIKRILVFLIVVCHFVLVAQAHEHKCEHVHGANGRISWASDCGPQSAAVNPAHSNEAYVQHTAHTGHPTHNMLLLGFKEVFASHIVYKAPHNFQVILKLNLPREALAHYLALRSQNPTKQIVLLLDSMDLNSIGATSINGKILVRGSSNPAEATPVTLTPSQYEVIYFNELPFVS